MGIQELKFQGEVLEELLLDKDLEILNVGNEATLFTCRAKSIIDISLINRHTRRAVGFRNWRVLKEESHSDHRIISFTCEVVGWRSKFRRGVAGRGSTGTISD